MNANTLRCFSMHCFVWHQSYSLASLFNAIGLTLVLNLLDPAALVERACDSFSMSSWWVLEVEGLARQANDGDSCDCRDLSPSALVHRQRCVLTSNRLQLQMFPAICLVCVCVCVCVKLDVGSVCVTICISVRECFMSECFHLAVVWFSPCINVVCVLEHIEDLSNSTKAFNSTKCFRTLITNGTSVPYAKKENSSYFAFIFKDHKRRNSS